jgi:hypothetical protein
MHVQNEPNVSDWNREFVTWIFGIVLLLSIVLCAQLNCWIENRRERARSARPTENPKKT